MNVSFVSSQDIIDGINKTLKNKTDAVINIINDKLTVSVFALLEQNLRNVKEINFIIRDSRYLPKGEEVSREFEININDVLFNSYDITEKNKLQHFYQAKAMHNFIKKHVNVKRVTNACSVKSNLICIDDNFMFTGQRSLEMPDKRNSSVFAANFDAIVTDNDETGKEQIARCSEMFNQLWYNEQFTVSYKEQLLESLHFVYKEHSLNYCITLRLMNCSVISLTKVLNALNETAINSRKLKYGMLCMTFKRIALCRLSESFKNTEVVLLPILLVLVKHSRLLP